MIEVIKETRTQIVKETIEDVTFEAQVDTVVMGEGPIESQPNTYGVQQTAVVPVGSKRIAKGTAVIATEGGTTVIANFSKEYGAQLMFTTPQPDLYFAKVCMVLPTFITNINNM